MKIIDIRKHAIKFNEQYDWFDDDTNQEMRDYRSDNNNDFEMMNWEANQGEDQEQNNLPVFEIDNNDEDYGGILVDDIGEEPVFEDEELTDKYPETEEPAEVVDETVEDNTEIDEKVPDFSNAEDAMNWAINNNRVVEIFYVTQGRKRGRGGRILKREVGLQKDVAKGGVHIHRIIEPHYIYQAKNGNKILVSYDRSVRHIRAFIVDNIYQYNFTKNRKTGKDQYFKPKIIVKPRPEKGIKIMKNINEKLIKIASELNEKGLKQSSFIVKEAAKVLEMYKTAQYVGVQGYWLKNRRCWDNCYRQKRTSSPATPAQEVWTECWDEYKKSVNNNKSDWAKYADAKDVIKISSGEEITWNKIFIKQVEDKVKQGIDRPVAIYDLIESESKRFNQKVIEASSNLMALADSLTENGYNEIGSQMAEASLEMLKEAQFSGGAWDKFKDFFRTKGGKIAERLDRLIQNINKIMIDIQGNVATASVKTDRTLKTAMPAPTVPAPAVNQPAPAVPAPAANQTAPASNQSTSATPTPIMPENLSPAQTRLYGQFLSDLRKEMGYLTKMQTKNPEIRNVATPAVQAIGNFLTQSDKLFQATGKKTFNREQVMMNLSSLLNTIAGVENVAKEQESAQPAATPAAQPAAPPAAQNQAQTKDIGQMAKILKKDYPEFAKSISDQDFRNKVSSLLLFLQAQGATLDVETFQGLLQSLASGNQVVETI